MTTPTTDMAEHESRRQKLRDELVNAPSKGIEKCWCGKQFFWVDVNARDRWLREHVHADCVCGRPVARGHGRCRKCIKQR